MRIIINLEIDEILIRSKYFQSPLCFHCNYWDGLYIYEMLKKSIFRQ